MYVLYCTVQYCTVRCKKFEPPLATPPYARPPVLPELQPVGIARVLLQGGSLGGVG
jgi:hypothetical protein